MVDKENYNEYRIMLRNPELATMSAVIIDAFCFAEAASQAYLIKNNYNAMRQGKWWRIDSISEIRPAVPLPKGTKI